MTKKIVFLFFLSWNVFFAQEKSTVSYTNTPLIEVIKGIKKQYDVRFFYKSEWLDGVLISGTFSNTGLDQTLTKLLSETNINFFRLNNADIILTSNTAIYNTLPNDFFNSEELNRPIFDKEDRVTVKQNITTVKIGKKDKGIVKSKASLSGQVTADKNGLPVPNVSVKIVGENKGVQTYKDGFFKIDLPLGTQVLEFRSLGYESVKKRIIIYNDGVLNLKLNESVESLDEVIIKTNIEAKKNVEETITGVSRIKAEEIKTIPLILGERDIFKVATTLPGITKTGEGAAGFNVRGGKEDQNLILLDDAVIYNPAHLFGLFSAINPFTTNDVNIYKGSIPAQYGGRLSSVFDIRTKTPEKKKFKGEGAIGPVTSNLHLEIPIIEDKSGLIVGGRGTYSRWILRSLDEPQLKKSEASFFDVVLKYDYNVNDKNKIATTGYYSKDKYSITSDSLFGYSNSIGSLKWEHTFNDKNKGAVTLANSQYNFDIDFDANSNNDFLLTYKLAETNLKLNMKYKKSKGLKFDYGLSSKLYAISPSSFIPKNETSLINPVIVPRERGLELGAYVASDFKLTEKLSLYSGFRLSSFSFLGDITQNIYQSNLPKSENTLIETKSFDKNEVVKTYTGPEIRASLRYLLTDSFSVKGSYNSTYQYIHTLSNNTTAAPTDTWKLSDLNIKPQRANQVALGFYKNFNEDVLEFSLEGYYKTSDNLLDYKVGAQLLVNESIETEVLQGQGRAYGVEVLLKKKIGRLNGWIGYTYSKSRIKLDSEFSEERVNDGNYFPTNFDKPHDVSLVSNFKFTKRFSLSTNFVYQTGRPITYPVGRYTFNGTEYVTYSDRNKFRIPDYYRLDLSFNVEGNHKIQKLAHSFWNVSIYNVLGRNNPYSVFFVNENGELKAFKSSIFSIPVPTITYNFKF